MVQRVVVPEPPGLLEEVDDAVLSRILDAAADEFAAHGVRRTTMDDVARRARVGRNTVFRRLGSKDELVRAVLARELRRLFVDLDRVVAAGATPVDRIAGSFAATVAAIRAHPMMRSAFAESSGELAELTADGEVLRLATAYVVNLLTDERDRGAIRVEADIACLAETLVRVVHSIALVPDLACPLDSDAQVRAFAAAVLRPHLEF